MVDFIDEHRDAYGVEPICSVGDPYDNAPCESVIGLYKTEVIERRGPWRNVQAVEIATLEWVAWFNGKRLLAPLGYLPPAEYEAMCRQRRQALAAVAGLNQPSL